MDAIVAELEARVAASPNDTRVHAELGEGYLNRMLAAANGPERGQWGAKGAASFELALKLDETNWDARFALAQHHYWAGLGADSVRNFEKLVQQQSSRLTAPKHAQAYVWLGNLHADNGDVEGARAAWSAGLAVFPNHAVLLARLDALD